VQSTLDCGSLLPLSDAQPAVHPTTRNTP